MNFGAEGRSRVGHEGGVVMIAMMMIMGPIIIIAFALSTTMMGRNNVINCIQPGPPPCWASRFHAAKSISFTVIQPIRLDRPIISNGPKLPRRRILKRSAPTGKGTLTGRRAAAPPTRPSLPTSPRKTP